MIKGTFPIGRFGSLQTPFYYYDVALLQETINVVKSELKKYDYHLYYALKANTNPRILSIMAKNGFSL